MWGVSIYGLNYHILSFDRNIDDFTFSLIKNVRIGKNLYWLRNGLVYLHGYKVSLHPFGFLIHALIGPGHEKRC